MRLSLWLGSISVCATICAAGTSFAQPTADRVRTDLLAMERNAEIIRTLAGMGALDQAVRTRFLEARRNASEAARAELESAASEVIQRVDEEHERRLELILRNHTGWFPKSAFGERASVAAYQIVQHSDDVELKRDVLARMEPYLGTGEINPEDYAKLFDRLALQEGRSQRYGTQGTRCVGERHAVPDDVEEPGTLDERRARAGLAPMTAYLEGLDQIYGRCTEPAR